CSSSAPSKSGRETSCEETFSAERTAASSTGTLQPKDVDECSFCCSICLDLLKDLLTIPCGHSYCMKCLQGFMFTSISAPGSSRVGVDLDHRTGVLSFYSVSESRTLLHRVEDDVHPVSALQGDGLTPKQQKEMTGLLHKWRRVFSCNCGKCS
uniref:RING-type domain-containing protein n=1 Tax=Oryzias latipes TaxID=8090 RepID=A0A3B3HW24_ORYLA